MLFGYPAEAVAENWLHRSICCMLVRLHNAIKNGVANPTWPKVIPETHRELLKRRRGLRDRFNRYRIAFVALSVAQQREVHETLIYQNRLRRLLAGERDCKSVEELPAAIQEPIKELFIFAFNLLTELLIRDRHYSLIYSNMVHKVCPFCGIEAFDAPGAPREEDDHYLPRFKYPFAGANLWNLVPMGHKCNVTYKRTTDFMWNAGRRRKAVNPYSTLGFEISLLETQPFGGSLPHLPKWNIHFLPEAETAETWDEVFCIRERYQRDILDPSYTKWIDEFGEWCRRSMHSVNSATDLERVIRSYGEFLKFVGLSDRAFLKLAVCQMLLKQCQENNERIISILLQAVH